MGMGGAAQSITGSAAVPLTPVISQSPGTTVYPEHTVVRGFGIRAPASLPLMAAQQEVRATTIRMRNAPTGTTISATGASSSLSAAISTDQSNYLPGSAVIIS